MSIIFTDDFNGDPIVWQDDTGNWNINTFNMKCKTCGGELVSDIVPTEFVTHVITRCRKGCFKAPAAVQ